jgi:hypothetical protein
MQMTWLLLGLIAAGAALGLVAVTLAKRSAATSEDGARRAAAARAGVMLALAAILLYNAVINTGTHRCIEYALAAAAAASAVFDLRYRRRHRAPTTQ